MSLSCLPESINHLGGVDREAGWLTHAVVRVWVQQQITASGLGELREKSESV